MPLDVSGSRSLYWKAGIDTSNFLTSANKMQAVFGNLSKTAIATGSAMAAIGVSAALFFKSVSEAREFQSSFAGVLKTVDGLDDGMGNLTAEGVAMSEAFRVLAKQVPISVNELNKIGELGGQLGIAKKDLVQFTDTIARLGVSTDMTTEAAATEIARFVNITKSVAPEGASAAEQIERIGATMVGLGNNFATGEAEISSFAQRLASAGSQINFSQADILAYSAALASVGVNAEAGGTAFSKLFAQLKGAVANGDVDAFAEIAGLSADEFIEEFGNDAPGAIQKFLAGLDGIAKSGGNVFAVLDDLEIKDVRMKDAVLRLSGANELLADSLNLANREYEANTALINESEKRFQTLDSQLQLLGNNIADVFIAAGSKAIPSITSIVKSVNGLFAKLDNSPAGVKRLTDDFVAQRQQVSDSNKVIGDLLDTYTELSQKPEKTKEEQEKLNDAISTLSKIVPGAITSVDQYGNALGINADAVRAFQAAQNDLVKRQQADVFKGLAKDIKKEANELEKSQALLDEYIGLRDNLIKRNKEEGEFFTLGISGKRLSSTDAIAEWNEEIAKIAASVSGSSMSLDVFVKSLENFESLDTTTPAQLAESLGVTEDQAAALIERYKKLYESANDLGENVDGTTNDLEENTDALNGNTSATDKNKDAVDKLLQKRKDLLERLRAENEQLAAMEGYDRELVKLDQWFAAQHEIVGDAAELWRNYYLKLDDLREKYLKTVVTKSDRFGAGRAAFGTDFSVREADGEGASGAQYTPVVTAFDQLQFKWVEFSEKLKDGDTQLSIFTSSFDAFLDRMFGGNEDLKGMIGGLTNVYSGFLTANPLQVVTGATEAVGSFIQSLDHTDDAVRGAAKMQEAYNKQLKDFQDIVKDAALADAQRFEEEKRTSLLDLLEGSLRSDAEKELFQDTFEKIISGALSPDELTKYYEEGSNTWNTAIGQWIAAFKRLDEFSTFENNFGGFLDRTKYLIDQVGLTGNEAFKAIIEYMERLTGVDFGRMFGSPDEFLKWFNENYILGLSLEKQPIDFINTLFPNGIPEGIEPGDIQEFIDWLKEIAENTEATADANAEVEKSIKENIGLDFGQEVTFQQADVMSTALVQSLFVQQQIEQWTRQSLDELRKMVNNAPDIQSEAMTVYTQMVNLQASSANIYVNRGNAYINGERFLGSQVDRSQKNYNTSTLRG